MILTPINKMKNRTRADHNWGPLVDQLIDDLAERIADRINESPGSVQSADRPRLLNVKQAAEYLSRTPNAIRNLIAAGAIPMVRIGRRIFFDPRELDAWIDDNRQKPI